MHMLVGVVQSIKDSHTMYQHRFCRIASIFVGFARCALQQPALGPAAMKRHHPTHTAISGFRPSTFNDFGF
jgi:hypothetical protein